MERRLVDIFQMARGVDDLVFVVGVSLEWNSVSEVFEILTSK